MTVRTLRLNDTEYAFCDELGMETVDVRELKLQGCMGCGACERRIHHGGECAVADDMQMLYPKIAQCEKLVFICRQSFGCCSPKCKRILDRMVGAWLSGIYRKKQGADQEGMENTAA